MGYILLNIAFLASGLALIRAPKRPWRAGGWLFIIAGGLTLALRVFYSTFYTLRLDYRFEVTAILITWLALIVVPVLLSIAVVRTGPLKYQPAARAEVSNRS